MIAHVDRLQQLCSALAGLGVGMEQATAQWTTAHAAACWMAVAGMLALAFLRALGAERRPSLRSRAQLVLRGRAVGGRHVGVERGCWRV